MGIIKNCYGLVLLSTVFKVTPMFAFLLYIDTLDTGQVFPFQSERINWACYSLYPFCNRQHLKVPNRT